MGSVITSTGECVVSCLVQRLGALKFVSDNAGCCGFRPFPRSGRFITFGAHEVYVGTVSAGRYLERVLVAADPPSHSLIRARRRARPVESVEVMMTAPDAPAVGAAGKGVAGDVPPEPEKNKRTACPPMERSENLAGTSRVPAKPLQYVIDRLQESVHAGDDLGHAQAILEEQREALVDEALAMQQVHEDFARDQCEYDAAHGFTPITNQRSRVEEVKTRGRDLNAEIERDNKSRNRSAAFMCGSVG
jgi:hypothetical protein